MEKKTARFIITFACHRNCSYCCNNYSIVQDNMRKITSLNELEQYEVINITGGEPMLNPERTLTFVKELRKRFPNTKLYLYTAHAKSNKWLEILEQIDGITFTLHENATIEEVNGLAYIQLFLENFLGKSNRLSIDSKCSKYLNINPSLWQQIKIKKWFTEKELDSITEGNGAPVWEDMLIWAGDDKNLF